MNNSFYRAFEERYRGSRELIKERQQVYLPFILPLKTIYSECPTLDLGCGRGEWLELLLENNVQAKGIDLDKGMLGACVVLGLPAVQAEAVDTLENLPDESLCVISGFHIAEHMPFSQLRRLIAAALRVLKPAGLLLLETPNSENLIVGSSSFYLDPTHDRPIPHLLLTFLTEHEGFTRSKVLRLQEDPLLEKAEHIGLINVLNGASPDYAIVAQKAAPDEQLALFSEPFNKEYGLTLDALADRYESGLQNRFKELLDKMDLTSRNETTLRERQENFLSQVESRLTKAEDSNETLRQQLLQATGDLLELNKNKQSLRSTLEQTQERVVTISLDLAGLREINQALAGERDALRNEVSNAKSQIEYLETHPAYLNQRIEDLLKELSAVEAHKHSQQLEAQQLQMLQELNSSLSNAHQWYLQAIAHETRARELIESTSWGVTAPLRTLKRIAISLIKCLVNSIKYPARVALIMMIRSVQKRPPLRDKLIGQVRRSPKLSAHLRQFAIHHHVLSTSDSCIEDYEPKVVNAVDDAAVDLSLLTPRARTIYNDLKHAIAQKSGNEFAHRN